MCMYIYFSNSKVENRMDGCSQYACMYCIALYSMQRIQVLASMCTYTYAHMHVCMKYVYIHKN